MWDIRDYFNGLLTNDEVVDLVENSVIRMGSSRPLVGFNVGSPPSSSGGHLDTRRTCDSGRKSAPVPPGAISSHSRTNTTVTESLKLAAVTYPTALGFCDTKRSTASSEASVAGGNSPASKYR